MIPTKSKFYFLTESVTRSNFKIDFTDTASNTVREATMQLGPYSPFELGVEIQRAMNEASTEDYTVTFNRTTRKYTISSASNFSLLASSGANVTSDIFQLAGFDSSDKSGSNSYVSDNAVGVEYIPQFPIQQYVSTEDFQEKIKPSVNTSASGRVEVVSFGIVKYAEMNIKYITDLPQGTGGIIDNDSNAVSKARTFLQTLIQKRNCEFMEDRDNPSNFEIFLLEKSSRSGQGVGYLLKELLSQSLAGYFETGKLTFRKMG